MAGADGGAKLGARPRWRWDVALSFAGAQRDYVRQVVGALRARGVRCFYDADEEIELWGKYLAEELSAIYGEQAAAVVVCISAEYAAGDWTRLERRAALGRAVRERREYVLPARFDDTPLPGLLSDMVTVDLRTRTPQQFATLIVGKLAALSIDTMTSGSAIGLSCDAEPRPWLMTGANTREARGHFTRRSLGQRSKARGGDLFRGRQAALDRITGWLASDEPPGLPLVVTGQPGAGKSAVLARAVLGTEAGCAGPGLAFHARAATIGDFLAALASLTGMETPATVDDLIAGLAGRPAGTPIPVAVDALDEAASDQDRRLIAEALAELAVLPGLRVAAAARPLAAGNPYQPGALLPMLGVTARDALNLIDLDSDIYFDLGGLREFAAALLAQDGMNHPGPPGAAWTQYRINHVACGRLAGVIAERAGRNFLVAAMAAVPLSTARDITDPAAKGFDPGDIPSGVGEALGKYLDQMPEQRREHDRALLTALAYARGAGLDDRAWLAFAAALDYDTTLADLDALHRSPAADYLLQTITADRGARPVTRLFHQALADELLAARRHRPGDESLLLDLLVGLAGRTGWQDRYAREHAADHARIAGRLDELLDDPLYLIAVDPARLVPFLDAAGSAAARAAAVVYRQTAHQLAALDRPMRASQLELTAHQLGCCGLAARIANTSPDRPWQTRWSHGRLAINHQVLTGHRDSVEAVAVGALPDGTPVVVSGDEEGTVRVWRLADGASVGEPMRGHGAVYSVAVGALPDGTPVVVSGGEEGTVRVWRLADGASVGEPMRGHRDSVEAVAVGALPDGTPVVVSGGYDARVRVWRLADGSPVGKPLRGHRYGVSAMAVGALRDGTPVVVSGGSGGSVRVWRLADGSPVGKPLRGHRGWVSAVAVGTLGDGTPVVVSGGDDATVRVWRLADGSPLGKPLRGHRDGVHAVAVGALPDGTPVVVSGGDEGTVRVWRLADGSPVGEPLRGHDGAVYAVAVGALLDGSPVLVSGGFRDKTVRVWRLADGSPVGEPLRGHDGAVYAVAVGTLRDGTPVVVSGGDEGTVRVWRLADGSPVGEPLRGHDGTVHAVAMGMLADGTPVAVSGGCDKTVRLWRLADGSPVGEPLRGHRDGVHAVAVGALGDGTPVVVSGSGFPEGTMRLWRLADGSPVGEPLRGHDGTVHAVAMGMLADGTPVVVSGKGGSVQVWRLADGAPVGEPLRGDDGPRPGVALRNLADGTTVVVGRDGLVHAVAVGMLGDRAPVVVSGDSEGSVQVWRLADGTPAEEVLAGHDGAVYAVAMGMLADGTPVAVSGGGDKTVRVWRLADGMPPFPALDLPQSVTGVAVYGDVIVSAAGADIAVHQLANPGPNV